jgi:hypothetical protein
VAVGVLLRYSCSGILTVDCRYLVIIIVFGDVVVVVVTVEDGGPACRLRMLPVADLRAFY